MANVVRFTLPVARNLYLPGVGFFRSGVLDVDANRTQIVERARYLAQPYRAIEVGIVPSNTPPPTLPAVPVPPPADPYPQYVTDADLADPASGPSVALRAASVAAAAEDIADPATGLGAAARAAIDAEITAQNLATQQQAAGVAAGMALVFGA